MNTRKLHQALRRTLVPTWCLAACLAWGDSPTLAPIEKKLLSALVSTSEDEKLRAIDGLVNRQCTSLEVRSALRRASIQDASPEVRGAARFALVKLQALAPATQTAPSQNVVAAIVPDETQRLRDLKLKETIEEVNDSAADKEIAQAGAVTSKPNNRGIQHAIPQPSDVAGEDAESKVVRITTINSPPSGPVQVAGSSNTHTDTTQAPSPKSAPIASAPSKAPSAAIASVDANPVWHSAMKPSEAAMQAGAEKTTLPTIAASEGPTPVSNEVPVPVTEPSTPKVPSTVPNPVPVPSVTLAPAEPPKVPINTPAPEASPTEVATVPAVAPSVSPVVVAPVIVNPTVPAEVAPTTPPAAIASAPAIAETPPAPAVPPPAPAKAPESTTAVIAASPVVAETSPAPAVPRPAEAPAIAPPAIVAPAGSPVMADATSKSAPAAPAPPPAVLDQLPAVGVGTSKAPLAPPAVASAENEPNGSSAPGTSSASQPKPEAISTNDVKSAEEKSEKITAFAGKKIPRTETRAPSSTNPGGMTEFPPVRTPSALAASMGQDEPKESKPAPTSKLPPAAPASVPSEKPAWGVPSSSVATNKGLGKPETTTAQLEKSPLIPIESIPRDEEGRKKMAKDMLDKGRKFVEAGQIAEAESVLYQVRELAIKYGRFQYTPESLEKDIIKARQRLRAQAAAAVEKTT